MTIHPGSSSFLNLKCLRCLYLLAARPQVPTSCSDPFARDRVLDALSPYQRSRLFSIFERDGLGERYHDARWSKCQIEHVIRTWHTTDGSLAISGGVGLGKTMSFTLLMACLASRNEYSFTYVRAPRLLDILHSRNGWGKDTANDGAYTDILHAKYLFIDDAGTEYASPMAMSRLNDLIENRHGRRAHHVINSNLSEPELSVRDGWERMVDRIMQDAEWVELGGTSQRRS